VPSKTKWYCLLNESTLHCKDSPSKILENNVPCFHGTGEHLTHNCPDITLFEKTNKVVYLIYIGIPKWGNLQTSYTNIMRKYAELNIQVKQQWQVEGAYT